MVKRKDLVDISDDDYKQRQGEFMQCQECGFEFGGTQGDYFMRPMEYVFQCSDCRGYNIALVKTIKTIKIINQ
ncbi:MAG TPA: hypothetical protein ENH82_06485 [bacterium]|nr:hypothetical protein [bacterium]